jgi:deoxyribonuclease (pyrimidine dimer)
MTRINVVPVNELTDRHLLAEYRELPRVYRLARRWWDRGCPGELPLTYTMGEGHVRFFYNKLLWVFNRHHELYGECLRRGFNVQPPRKGPDSGFEMSPLALFNNWKPTITAKAVNQSRICERLGG